MWQIDVSRVFVTFLWIGTPLNVFHLDGNNPVSRDVEWGVFLLFSSYYSIWSNQIVIHIIRFVGIHKKGVPKDSLTYSNFIQIPCGFRNLIYGWNWSKSNMKFLQIFLFMIVNEKTSAILKMILILYEFHSLNKVSLLIKGKITNFF